jgi:hypothetical protein
MEGAPVGTVPLRSVVERLSDPGLGFERVMHLPGSTYKESATAIVVPSRGKVPTQVVNRLLNLIAPMNQKRAFLFTEGEEVGHAYNRMIESILADPMLSTWPFVLTLEEDNLPPADAHIKLLETIDRGFDAVSGIYFTKGDFNMPMAYGDPRLFRETGKLDFRPIDVTQDLTEGRIREVNGIAMGCALYRMNLFREIPPPWFVTVNDVVPGKGAQCYTQDLYFCERARRAGKRFAVDMRVRVGHLDVEKGEIY